MTLPWKDITPCYVLFSLLQISSGSPHGFFSSCDNPSDIWNRNTGVEIQSWISSIVPGLPHEEEDEMFPTATFHRAGNLLSVMEVVSTNGFGWRAFGKNRYDGWFYGMKGQRGEFVTYYIFPDYVTALVGTFDKEDRLTEGRETKVTRFRCRDGVMELKFGAVDTSSPLLRHIERNSTFISEFPKRRDPLERRNVYIGPTQFLLENQTQDGLRARRYLPPYSLIAYYNGVWQTFQSTFLSPNMTLDQREDKLKNLLRFNDTHCLDVPKEYSDITAYRSTLSHKVNHHFRRANSKFCWAKHPVYGQIRCLESIQPIHRGQEILAHYGYKLNGEYTPRWYNRMYHRIFVKKT